MPWKSLATLPQAGGMVKTPSGWKPDAALIHAGPLVRIPAGIDFYADSNAAGPGDGSFADPFNTLADLETAALAFGDGVSLALKSGSHWRESLNLAPLSGVSVGAYGSGDPPLVDGSDIITGWTAYTDGGVLHMYQKTVANQASTTGRLFVLEDGVEMTRVTTDAACDAMPGSFVNPYSGGSTPANALIKIHPYGSTDATSDGKVREINVRSIAFAGSNDCTVFGIHTRMCSNNNGSTDLVDKYGAAISRVIMEWGTKHNGGFGGGGMTDCIAIYSNLSDPDLPASVGENPIVVFKDDATGLTGLVTRVGVIGSCSEDHFCHVGGGGQYVANNAIQIWTLDTAGFTGSFTNLTGGYYRGVISLPFKFGIVSKCMIGMGSDGFISSPSEILPVTVTDTVIHCEQRLNNFEVLRPVGVADFINCAFYINTSLDSGLNTNFMYNSSAAQDMNLSRCVFFNGTAHMTKHSSGTIVSDYNVFIASNVFAPTEKCSLVWDGVAYTTLAGWQGASGQDANSVYLDRSDQSRGDANAFWLGVANDENDGPDDGDWRINPHCRVKNGANVALKDNGPGGFTAFDDDTTLITTAGPQTHWDWNLRAEAAGPPTQRPTAPETLVEVKAYVLDPSAWNFYP